MVPEEILQKWLIRLILLTPILATAVVAIWAEVGWMPQPQPIAFSHKVHAGDHKIACEYCHRGSHDGYYAGVPSVQDCYDCHRMLLVEKKTVNGKHPPLRTFPNGKLHANTGVPEPLAKANPEVAKLIKDYVKERRDIRWFKNYDLPQHVKFAHKAHIAAGLQCIDCHGQVQDMQVIRLKERPTMGWCVSCHRVHHAPVECTTCHR